VPYITPQDIPESDDCRFLSIPASPEWLALFGGALTAFLYPYNWEQTTGITVDETIAKMREIIDGFYEGCATCDLPGGYKVIRITPDGHIEVLEDGEYVTPTEGDYYLPPPDAREGGTPEDQICLAAKNAVNVLNLLYESLSDSWAAELTVDEAIIAFIGAISTAALFALIPITWALVIPLIAFFWLVYKALAYLTADLWTEEYTNKLICLFVQCASNDDGVVTFDWSCLEDGLNQLATEGGFNEVQTRLNLQIGYILQFIGGIDALNLAARTTDITNDDCLFCEGCVRYDFTLAPSSWSPDTYGNWVTGEGWQANLDPSAIFIGYDDMFPARVASVDVEYYNSGGTGVMALYYYDGSYHAVTVGEPLLSGEQSFRMYGVSDTGVIPNLFFNANADTGATVYIRAITICYL